MAQLSSTPLCAMPSERPVHRSVSSYTALAQRVREAGLLRRRRGYYWWRIAGAVTALGLLIAAVQHR